MAAKKLTIINSQEYGLLAQFTMTYEVKPEKDGNRITLPPNVAAMKRVFTENLLSLVPAKSRKAAENQLEALLEITPFAYLHFTHCGLTYDINGNVQGLDPFVFEPANIAEAKAGE